MMNVFMWLQNQKVPPSFDVEIIFLVPFPLNNLKRLLEWSHEKI